jgi:hypothetical protein
MTNPQPARQQINLATTAEVEAGVYADFVGVWHHESSFVIDFAALTGPPVVKPGDDGQPVTQVKARLVSRVRIPPSQVFEIMKALEQQLSNWERETGQRQPDPDAQR